MIDEEERLRKAREMIGISRLPPEEKHRQRSVIAAGFSPTRGGGNLLSRGIKRKEHDHAKD